MDKETENLVIHIAVMFSISLFFMIYFRTVQHSPELQQQIWNNAFVIPAALILAYEGYSGYILVKLIRKYQENKNKKIKRDLLNVIILIGRTFHEYVMWVVDLIGITITVFAFFIYSNPNPSPKVLGIMDISDFYFLVFVPSTGILIHILLFKRKLEYR